MRKNMLVGVVLLAVAIVAVGCAKPPQQEIDAAKAALDAASQAEAPKYAVGAWDAAQQAMNAVNAELEAQQAKFALFRSYTKAKQLIVDATNAANAAKDAGIAGKEKAKNEAQVAIEEVKAAVASATELLDVLDKCRRKPKDMKKDLDLMKGNVEGQAAQVADLDGKFAREDYLGAKSQAAGLKSRLTAMVDELNAAKTKIKC